jgi:hypothetical protein
MPVKTYESKKADVKKIDLDPIQPIDGPAPYLSS